MSATNTDQVLRYAGFSVEITGVDGAPSQQDGSWSSVTGGALAVEVAGVGVSARGGRTYTPGKAYVTELVLRGPITPGRKALLAWLRESAAGKAALRHVTITPIEPDGKPGPKRVYEDCAITRYEMPSLDAGSADPVEEVVVLRPTRYNDPA